MLALFSLSLAPGRAQEIHWGYAGQTGPEYWADLSEMFALCASGKEQSPIDLSAARQEDISDLEIDYRPSGLNVVNNGHTIQANYDAGSYIVLDGTRYELMQFHFHTPSEHLLDGRRADMEIHFVHRSMTDEGMLAVLGLLVYEGEEDNPVFSQLWQHLPMADDVPTSLAQMVDAGAMLPSDPRVYRYRGSLTTPPCSQGVSWNVFEAPITLSRAQLDALHAIIGDNARPAQPLNGRSVVADSARR